MQIPRASPRCSLNHREMSTEAGIIPPSPSAHPESAAAPPYPKKLREKPYAKKETPQSRMPQVTILLTSNLRISGVTASIPARPNRLRNSTTVDAWVLVRPPMRGQIGLIRGKSRLRQPGRAEQEQGAGHADRPAVLFLVHRQSLLDKSSASTLFCSNFHANFSTPNVPAGQSEFFVSLTYFCIPHIIIVPDRQRRVPVQALKHNSVPESLVMWSFREGLCSETSNRSRLRPNENARNRPVYHVQDGFLFITYTLPEF